MDGIDCPGCGAAMARLTDHGIHYECAACSGRMVGFVPFEKLLAAGEGQRIWQACEQGQAAGRCPFCAHDLHAPSTGAPAGLALCRQCAQVWIPSDAQQWLSSQAATPATAAADASAAPDAHPHDGLECGAPWEPDERGRCRYCKTQLAQPPAPVVVMMPQPHAEAPPGPLAGLAKVLLSDW